MTSRSESVRKLFDEMAETYGLVHLFSSLGFAYSWRRACSSVIPSSSRRVLDVMAGCGEMAPHLEKRLGAGLDLTLLDFSEGMCRRATQNAKHWPRSRVTVVQDDALRMPFADGVFDAVTCSFGLKTLTANEVRLFAAELFRVVRPGGTVSLLEFSMPKSPLLLPFFRLYVRHYVPFLGRLFLGNPDNYRMLWEYTQAFQNCSSVIDSFRQAGFQAEFRSHFFGSATQIVAVKLAG